jgi:predicted aldo/keto reductase-like oxidoreductase
LEFRPTNYTEEQLEQLLDVVQYLDYSIAKRKQDYLTTYIIHNFGGQVCSKLPTTFRNYTMPTYAVAYVCSAGEV